MSASFLTNPVTTFLILLHTTSFFSEISLIIQKKLKFLEENSVHLLIKSFMKILKNENKTV
jgi:hypothetical protein